MEKYILCKWEAKESWSSNLHTRQIRPKIKITKYKERHCIMIKGWIQKEDITIVNICAPTSVHFSRSVVSDSLKPHESQHARPPCPSPTPGVHSDLRPLSQWCHPAISSSVVPFSSCPSIRVFSNESALLMRWPKYWSFSIIPSKEIPGLISFRMVWLDLLAVQGTLKRLLQHHSSKASILWRSAFFTVQLSHPYMTTGKTIALTRWILVRK